jgi:hypothetical protein
MGSALTAGVVADLAAVLLNMLNIPANILSPDTDINITSFLCLILIKYLIL